MERMQTQGQWGVRDEWVSPEGAAAFLIRLGLGMLFLTAGLNKFMAPGGVASVSAAMREGFAGTWLPPLLTAPFLAVLPFIEVPLGVLLVAGLRTRMVLTFTGLLLVALSFGKMVEQEWPTVADNLTYVLMVSVALWLSARANPYSLDAVIRKFRQGGARRTEV